MIKTSESKYATCYMFTIQIKRSKDEIITNLASVSDMSTKMETYYLKKYNFDVYESAIKEIKESNEDYFG